MKPSLNGKVGGDMLRYTKLALMYLGLARALAAILPAADFERDVRAGTIS